MSEVDNHKDDVMVSILSTSQIEPSSRVINEPLFDTSSIQWSSSQFPETNEPLEGDVMAGDSKGLEGGVGVWGCEHLRCESVMAGRWCGVAWQVPKGWEVVRAAWVLG